jgi:hypothetical protein
MESRQQRVTAGYRCCHLLLREDVCDRCELEFRFGILTQQHQPRVRNGGQQDTAIEERHDAALANDGAHGGIGFLPQRDDGCYNIACIRAALGTARQQRRWSRRRVARRGLGTIGCWHVLLRAGRHAQQSVTTLMGFRTTAMFGLNPAPVCTMTNEGQAGIAENP